MRGIVLLVGMLLFIVGANAVFDEAFRRLQLRPGGLSVMDSVRCTADQGRRFNVPLVPVRGDGSSGAVWRPQSPDL